MKRSILILAATAMTVVVLCNAAEAKPGSKNGPSFGRPQNLVTNHVVQSKQQFVQTPKLFTHIQGSHIRTADRLLVNKGALKSFSPTIVVKDYNLRCGTKCSFGYCYKGYTHCHWTNSCYLPTCGCECYYDPCTLGYFYWCVPDSCWYPITYCPYGCYTF